MKGTLHPKTYLLFWMRERGTVAIAPLMIKRKEAPGGPGPLLRGKDTFARTVSNLQCNYEEKMNLIKDD